MSKHKLSEPTIYKMPMPMNNYFNMFLDTSLTISDHEIWVCTCEGYLYTSDTLPGLIAIMNAEWKHDKHIGE